VITRVVYRTDSVFRYEPFGIFLVFTIPIPKENSASILGILKLAGASYTRGAPGGGASVRERRARKTTTTYEIRPVLRQ
jgi:hypothetical protein